MKVFNFFSLRLSILFTRKMRPSLSIKIQLISFYSCSKISDPCHHLVIIPSSLFFSGSPSERVAWVHREGSITLENSILQSHRLRFKQYAWFWANGHIVFPLCSSMGLNFFFEDNLIYPTLVIIGPKLFCLLKLPILLRKTRKMKALVTYRNPRFSRRTRSSFFPLRTLKM